MRTAWLLLIFSFSLATICKAQSPTGTISGIVVDPSGGVVGPKRATCLPGNSSSVLIVRKLKILIRSIFMWNPYPRLELSGTPKLVAFCSAGAACHLSCATDYGRGVSVWTAETLDRSDWRLHCFPYYRT